MMHPASRVAALLLVLFALAPVALAQSPGPVRVAVFDFELIDTSLEGELTGPKEAETRRLGRLGEQLRDAFRAADGFELVDIAPVADRAHAKNLQRCGACDLGFAREVGADWSVTGTVQKVSNLILNINIYVRDVDGGELVQAMSADIRGNTDQSWQRGLSWLIRNRLDLSR